MNSDSTSGRSTDKHASRRRLTGWLLVAMLASLLLMSAPLPVAIAAGVTSLVALVLLIVLIVRSIGERRYGMAMIGTLLGVPAMLMVIFGATLNVLFYGPMSELEDCRSTALTEQARVQCESALPDSMAQWVSDLFG